MREETSRINILIYGTQWVFHTNKSIYYKYIV